MTVDESSSQDATLIDDDLVAALGFEPLTPSEGSNGHGEDSDESLDSASGDTLVEAAVDDDITVADAVVDEAMVDDIAVVDDLVVDDSVVDAPVDGEIETDLDGVDLRQDLGAVDGFGVDEVVLDTAANESVDEFVVDEAAVDSGVVDTDNFFDEVTDHAADTDDVLHSGAVVDTDNFFDDESIEAVDSGADVDAEIVADVEPDEAEASSASFFDLDEDATDDGPLDDGGAAEPIAAELDGAASGAAVIDLDLDEPSTAVIDLDPVSDRLADADDVFADVAVGDVDVHPSTESLDLVGLEDGTVVGELAVSLIEVADLEVHAESDAALLGLQLAEEQPEQRGLS